MQRSVYADNGDSSLHAAHKHQRVEDRDGAHDLCDDGAEIVC